MSTKSTIKDTLKAERINFNIIQRELEVVSSEIENLRAFYSEQKMKSYASKISVDKHTELGNIKQRLELLVDEEKGLKEQLDKVQRNITSLERILPKDTSAKVTRPSEGEIYSEVFSDSPSSTTSRKPKSVEELRRERIMAMTDPTKKVSSPYKLSYKNKYLKYKMKYLELKNKFNQN